VVTLAVWPWVPYALNLLVLIIGIFLILLVLIQRGKGGGLAGAFGGVGGSSAFGSRAGDLFTKITIIVASVWIVLTMAQVMAVQDYAKDSGKRETLAVPTGESESPNE
jgi:preprotein translocase subunit SecG